MLSPGEQFSWIGPREVEGIMYFIMLKGAGWGWCCLSLSLKINMKWVQFCDMDQSCCRISLKVDFLSEYLLLITN